MTGPASLTHSARTLSASAVAKVLTGTPLEPPMYAALAGRLRRAFIEGRLPAGARMPSERELMTALEVSRTTVTRAYQELRDSGHLRTTQGSGSRIFVPDVPGGRVDHLLSPSGTIEDEIDLTTTAPSAAPLVPEAFQIAAEKVVDYLPGTGYYPSGLPVLREMVAARFTQRGLPTDPDQILITSGALGGAAIAAQALLAPGDRVLVEKPCYPNIIETLKGLRARIVPHAIDMNDSGQEWDAEGMAALLRLTGARSAYLVPDFQNPTGILMDDAQRERVGAALRQARVVPIIDESPVELSLQERAMPLPLAAYVPDSITVGSVSKVYWCGLRIGWMRLPKSRIASMAQVRLRLDLGAPVLEQLAAVELMARHEESLEYRRVRENASMTALLAGIHRYLPDWKVARPPGGGSLWCQLPDARSTALVSAARKYGVVLASGPTFAPGGGLDDWLRLPFVLSEEVLAGVPARLAQAWADTTAGQPRVGWGQTAAPIIA